MNCDFSKFEWVRRILKTYHKICSPLEFTENDEKKCVDKCQNCTFDKAGYVNAKEKEEEITGQIIGFAGFKKESGKFKCCCEFK